MSILVREAWSGLKPDIIYDAKYILSYTDLLHIHEQQIAPDQIRYFITFKFKPLKIKTPELKVMFGLQEYPANSLPKRIKYSLHLNLDDENTERFEFKTLLETLDMLAFQRFQPEYNKAAINKENDQSQAKSLIQVTNLISAIRPCYKDNTKSPTLRIKIPVYQDNVLVNLYVNNELMGQDIATFRKHIIHGCLIKAMFICNGAWKRANAYGVTYKLKTLKVIKPKLEI